MIIFLIVMLLTSCTAQSAHVQQIPSTHSSDKQATGSNLTSSTNPKKGGDKRDDGLRNDLDKAQSELNKGLKEPK